MKGLGRRSSGRGTRARRAAAATLACGLALAPLALGLPHAQAIRNALPTAANPVQVTINRITPLAPQPGDTLVVAGTLRNATDAPLTNLNYELKLATGPLSSRSAFDTFAADQDGDVTALYPVSGTLSPATQPTLAAGASEPFRISADVNGLASAFGLGASWQVREMGVSVTSSFTPVGHVRTFLPWAPRGTAETPLGVAWILPLTDRPHRTTSTAWFDDLLPAALGTDQRLGALVAAGSAAESQTGQGRHSITRAVPISWAIDPMLVRDVHDLAASAGYTVTTSVGAKKLPPSPAAAAYLVALHNAVAQPDASVFALPFGDPDVVAAVRANLTSAVGLAAANGRSLLSALLGVTLARAYGWPPGGVANDATVNTLTAIGDRPLILSDAALPPAVTPPATPNAATSIITSNGPVPALLTDSGLTADVTSGDSAGVTNPDGSRISLQRFLAETLMIHAESPNTPGRNVILAPARHWAPSVAYATAVLADTGKVPWITPTTLGDVADSAPGASVAHRGLVYPPSARNNELSQGYLDQVRQLRARIANFGTILILPQNNTQVRDLATAAQQLLSTGWRGNHGLAIKALNSLRGDVDTAINQVRVASRADSYITLTSHGGKVPVTIENDLATPVRIMVRLNSHHRLELPNNGRITETLPANQLTRVDFRATANTSGVFQVDVQLLTPDGKHKYGGPVRLRVKSTVYGTITLVITGAATGALLIAVAVRLTRRALAARRSGTTTAS